MEYNINFIINNKLEISWDDGYYKSNIENVEKEIISISIPIKEGQYIPPRVGEMLEVIYYYENEIYKFYTTVVGRKHDKIPLVQIAYPKEVYQVQRRKFVRVPIVCNVLYSKLEDKYEKNTSVSNEPDKAKDLKGVMVDLSGGGMRIKLKENLKLGEKLAVYLPVGEDNLPLMGEIVRVDYDEVNKLNICGLNFIALEEKTREKLIRLIFQIMREQMKKRY